MKKLRDKPTGIRFTEAEHAFFKEAARRSGVTFGNLIRASARLAFGLPSIEDANIRRFNDIASGLQRLGNNLNQITRKVNSGALELTDNDGRTLNEATEMLDDLRAAFDEYQRLAHERDPEKVIKELAA